MRTIIKLWKIALVSEEPFMVYSHVDERYKDSAENDYYAYCVF